MENSYSLLIEQERAKIALLKTKIAECEHRIRVLASMMNADDLDNILAKTVAHDVSPPAQPSPQEEARSHVEEPTFKAPKKKLSGNAIALLSFIASSAGCRSLDELESFSKDKGLGLDRGAIRSFVSNYRVNYGFLNNPKSAHVELTERGREYLLTHGTASKSETPPVGAEGVSGTSIQAAVEGGAESDRLV